jgi:parallel beta-helix repeat protein
MSRSVRPSALAAAVSLLAASLTAATYTVTNTADSGPGSLRQAITDSNGVPGSTVDFNIPGPGVKSIRPVTALPVVLTLVDGTTQPGYAGSPLIEIDGSLMPALTAAIATGGGALRALAINRASYAGILMSGNSGTVQGCYVGTDASGQVALGSGAGIYTYSGSYTIGGSGPGEGNLISGNGYGIYLQGRAGTQVLGNRIGTNAAGTAAVPNLNDGIFVANTSNATVGGATAAEGNLISGNNQYGIQLFYSDDIVIANNRIGPDVGGGATLPTQRAGIIVYQSSGARIGGPGKGNLITRSWDVGIGVEPTSVRNSISQNSLYGNTFGIDLNHDGVTPNDPCDADSGPNLLQNFPLISSVTRIPGSVTVRGTLNSEPSGDYDLEFFASPSANASGYGEGKTYLGTLRVTTDASCGASFGGSFAAEIPAGQVVAATATDSLGDTSEFSPTAVVVAETAGRLYTLAPCRLVDTRNSPGPLGGPALAAGATRTFVVTGSCGVPSDARALAVNVAVTQPTDGPGFLGLSDGVVPRPVVSTINYQAGQTRANNAIVRLGASGDISVFCGQGAGTAHFVLDVTGYFR